MDYDGAMSDVTRILSAIENGESAAADELLPLVYQELRQLAAAKLAHEKPGQTLQATVLVHEAWLRLVGSDVDVHWNGRGHFFGAAAKAMQRILVENARRKKRLKAGGEYQRVELSESAAFVGRPSVDVLAIDEALEKLNQQDHRKAELVRLRFFAGLTLVEAARALGISDSTADNDWSYAKTWLRLEMSESEETENNC
jgi:RNA polymerase sigma factor (TIGR02999 family)